MLDRVGDEARLLPFDVNRLILGHRSILVEFDRKIGILVETSKFVPLALGDVLTSARIGDTLLLKHRVAVLVGYRALGHRPLRIEDKALRHLVAALVCILEGGAEVPSLEDRAGHRGLSSCGVQVCGDIGSELLLGAAQQHSVVSIKIESVLISRIVKIRNQTIRSFVAERIVLVENSISLLVAGKIVEIGIFVQIIEANVNPFVQSISFSVALFCLTTRIILEPVIQMYLRCT